VAITFSGEFEVPDQPQEVYDFLTDPNRFAPLLPDFQGLTVQDATHFTVRVSVGIAHIRGTAETRMELAECDPPKRAVYHGQGALAGGCITMTASFDLSPSGPGTRVQWRGEAQIFGRLASVAGGLLEPLAKKNLQKLIDALRSALSAPLASAQLK
jgi:carbon monoxide dehydrogenase subunit G